MKFWTDRKVFTTLVVLAFMNTVLRYLGPTQALAVGALGVALILAMGFEDFRATDGRINAEAQSAREKAHSARQAELLQAVVPIIAFLKEDLDKRRELEAEERASAREEMRQAQERIAGIYRGRGSDTGTMS